MKMTKQTGRQADRQTDRQKHKIEIDSPNNTNNKRYTPPVRKSHNHNKTLL